ncbi:MAG: GntR family transcriptional regulator [Solirubrobacterales bacterium]
MTSQPEWSGLDRFEVSIDRDAEVPMGVQLAWALCASIQEGNFKPGQRLPPLREMAETTGLNINTVRAVYQRLEQKGLIQSQQGSGTFVASKPPPRSELARIASDAAREAHETGVDPRDVAAALYVSPTSSLRPADSAAQRRRVLRQQIAVLERAMGEIEAVCPGVAPPSRGTRRGVGPALLGVDDLERVRGQLVRRLAVVQDAVDRHLGQRAGQRETAGARAAASGNAARTRKRGAAKPDAPTKTKRAAQPQRPRCAAPAGT